MIPDSLPQSGGVVRIVISAAIILLAACGQDSPQDRMLAPAPIHFEQASSDKQQHGKRLAAVLGCTGCHGETLAGEDWSEPGFGKLWTANLSRAVPYYSDRQLADVIQTGRRPDRALWEMPSHLFTQLDPDDMAALIAFLRSVRPTGAIHPAPVFEAGARAEMKAGLFESSATHVAKEGKLWPPEAGADVALGRYIVRATCAECHQMDLRGGTPFPGAQPRPDLRMAAAYDRAQFKSFMRTGKAAGGRELKMMSDVARGRYSQLTDGELSAVHAYLQKVAANEP